MSWDLYLILKTGGIAVFVFAGGIAVSKALQISRTRAYLINTSAVIVGFVVNRLWYIVQHIYGSEEYEFRSIRSFLDAWDAWDDAGSILYGWILGGTAAIYLITKATKIDPVRYLDRVLPWLLIAQFLNRLGCFDAQCCYGKLTHARLAVMNSTAGGPVHPVQIYEALYDLALFAFIRAKARPRGWVTVCYFTAYPIARFGLEFLRGDNGPALWFMTVPQVTSVLILIAVLAFRKRLLL